MTTKATSIRSSNQSSIKRQWDMLKFLESSNARSKIEGRYLVTSEITEHLKSLGYDIGMRQVQRDLLALRDVFPIDVNDKNPRNYGWRWLYEQGISIKQLSTTEALAMRLVEAQLQRQFPNSMLQALGGIFYNAKKCLDKMEDSNNPSATHWFKKIKVVSPTQALLTPPIKPEIQDEIYDALLKNRKIRTAYRKLSGEQSQRTLNPLALILRGPVTYLVATTGRNAERKLYALHRFVEVESLLQPVETPDDFDLDAALKKGFSDFAVRDSQIEVALHCMDSTAQFLAETRLAEDQQIADSDRPGWKVITATVNDTDQLRRWILGQSAGMEVLRPLALRNEIKETLTAASQFYE